MRKNAKNEARYRLFFQTLFMPPLTDFGSFRRRELLADVIQKKEIIVKYKGVGESGTPLDQKNEFFESCESLGYLMGNFQI